MMTKDGLIFEANSLKQGRLQALTRQQLQAQATQNRGDFLRCGGQARTVSPVDVMAVIGSQLTYCVEVAAELLADVEEQTVRSVHQAQRPGRESPPTYLQADSQPIWCKGFV